MEIGRFLKKKRTAESNSYLGIVPLRHELYLFGVAWRQSGCNEVTFGVLPMDKLG